MTACTRKWFSVKRELMDVIHDDVAFEEWQFFFVISKYIKRRNLISSVEEGLLDLTCDRMGEVIGIKRCTQNELKSKLLNFLIPVSRDEAIPENHPASHGSKRKDDGTLESEHDVPTKRLRSASSSSSPHPSTSSSPHPSTSTVFINCVIPSPPYYSSTETVYSIQGYETASCKDSEWFDESFDEAEDDRVFAPVEEYEGVIDYGGNDPAFGENEVDVGEDENDPYLDQFEITSFRSNDRLSESEYTDDQYDMIKECWVRSDSDTADFADSSSDSDFIAKDEWECDNCRVKNPPMFGRCAVCPFVRPAWYLKTRIRSKNKRKMRRPQKMLEAERQRTLRMLTNDRLPRHLRPHDSDDSDDDYVENKPGEKLAEYNSQASSVDSGCSSQSNGGCSSQTIAGCSSSSADNRCETCRTEPKNGVFVHGKSGHALMCFLCSRKIYDRDRKCPQCRRPVTKVIQLFT